MIFLSKQCSSVIIRNAKNMSRVGNTLQLLDFQTLDGLQHPVANHFRYDSLK